MSEPLALGQLTPELGSVPHLPSMALALLLKPLHGFALGLARPENILRDEPFQLQGSSGGFARRGSGNAAAGWWVGACCGQAAPEHKSTPLLGRNSSAGVPLALADNRPCAHV